MFAKVQIFNCWFCSLRKEPWNLTQRSGETYGHLNMGSMRQPKEVFPGLSSKPWNSNNAHVLADDFGGVARLFTAPSKLSGAR
jgi:hypothetical protein